jgi:glucose/arabinose dehydrogenase
MKRSIAWGIVLASLWALPALAYTPNASDMKVPAGYKVEMVVTGLNTPMGVTWDEKGDMYVVESGWVAGAHSKGTAVEVYDPSGKHLRTLAQDKLDPNASLAVTYHAGSLYVSGTNTIYKVDPQSGAVSEWIKDLPSKGDHNVSKVLFKGEWAYFGLGSDTNSSVVGTDVAGPGLAAAGDHDVPCKDVTLSGNSFNSADAKPTSAFSKYGEVHPAGYVVKGQVPCTSSVLRTKISDPQNSIELMDWGFRNPFGLAFAPVNGPLKGALIVANNGADERGSRPIANSPDELHIAYGKGDFHGWPDSFGYLHANWKQASAKITGTYQGDNARGTELALEFMPPVAEPIALFPVDSSADGMDFSTNKSFGKDGDLFIALWGQIGFAPNDRSDSASKVVSVHFREPEGVVISSFLENKVPGAASVSGKGGLNHPIEARFSPDGKALYVTDFGGVDVHAFRADYTSGTIWKVTHE